TTSAATIAAVVSTVVAVHAVVAFLAALAGIGIGGTIAIRRGRGLARFLILGGALRRSLLDSEILRLRRMVRPRATAGRAVAARRLLERRQRLLVRLRLGRGVIGAALGLGVDGHGALGGLGDPAPLAAPLTGTATALRVGLLPVAALRPRLLRLLGLVGLIGLAGLRRPPGLLGRVRLRRLLRRIRPLLPRLIGLGVLRLLRRVHDAAATAARGPRDVAVVRRLVRILVPRLGHGLRGDARQGIPDVGVLVTVV